jgi:hypothetical protein
MKSVLGASARYGQIAGRCGVPRCARHRRRADAHASHLGMSVLFMGVDCHPMKKPHLVTEAGL